MKQSILTVFAIALAVLPKVSSAGSCSCKNQIGNASAEVSGSCSKVWSNNHCTLKEDSSTGSNLRMQDAAAGQSRYTDVLGSSNIFADEELNNMLYKTLEASYFDEFRGRCQASSDIPTDLFETYISSSLVSVKADLDISLLISSELLGDAIKFSRETSIADTVCADGELNKGATTMATYYWGGGCFAGGNSVEQFAINLSPIRGCPTELGF